MIGYEVERLLVFGLAGKLIEQDDVIPVRNALLDLLRLPEPNDGGIDDVTYTGQTATRILERMLDYASETGLIPENTLRQRDAFAARIMGLLTPRQSEVVKWFRENYRLSPTLATDEFYALSRASNYIQVDRVNKNIHWLSATEFGELEITINLSKPEIDPREIAAVKAAPQTNYPKCLLCAENAGFAGTQTHPARHNHRIISITLYEEQWCLQYSPYVYYNEHCIVFDKIHRPMKTRRETFCQLLDFVTQFPHYFIGSNTDLPIVGGSILSHDHYQGGRHVFPMEKAAPYRRLTHSRSPSVTVSLIRWPMPVIRMSSEHKDDLVELAMHVFEGWREYSDSDLGILASTGGTPHNTVTPIARRKPGGQFELDVVLRNNRTTTEHPYGLFHSHENLHHIKKENIGLIEVMGLAVLPGRLQKEFEAVSAVLQSRAPFDSAPFGDPAHPLHKHLDWMSRLTGKHGTSLTPAQAEALLKEEAAKIFCLVLNDAGVFKYDEQGVRHFGKFMKSLGFEDC